MTDDPRRRDADIFESLHALAGPARRSPADARTARLCALLDLLSTPGPAPDASLVDATLARMPREGDASLRREDARAIDAWVESSAGTPAAKGEIGERARTVEALAALVSTGAPSAPAGLAERTLEAIGAFERAERERLNIERRRGLRVRLSDVIGVAAALLIGASVIWPMLVTARDTSRRAVCHANLTDVARAFGGYASDHRSSLPSATAGYSGGSWLATGAGESRSNSANLYRLVRSRYVELQSLACPGNPHARSTPVSPDAGDWQAFEEVSFSYRVMTGPSPKWGEATSRTVVLTDRSPVFLRAIRGQPVHATAASPNHESRGQHMLFNDGTLAWFEEPVLGNGDNVWLPRVIEDELRRRRGELVEPMTGTESPGAVDDAFVGP